jgi:hypothetical protein
MKKILLWVGAVLAALIVLVLGVSALFARNYGTYQLRAQSSEAKVLLTALYTAEKMFEAEHEFFTTDLGTLELGWEPGSGLGPKRYRLGFVKPSQDPAAPGLAPTQPQRLLFTETGLQEATSKDFPPEASQRCADCTASKAHFKAFAVGRLGRAGAPDVWTIDDQHQLEHVVDGTR